MKMDDRLRQLLIVALEPTRLDIINESELHAGHRNSPGTGESHYRLLVISPKFSGLSRVARHRLVNEALGDIVGKQVHALALTALAPGEPVGRERAG